MKLIKLSRRHNLYHKGYHYAFRFDSWNGDRYKVEQVVRQAENGKWWDNTFFGKSIIDRRRGTRVTPYYIGFKKESTATIVMLKFGG